MKERDRTEHEVFSGAELKKVLGMWQTVNEDIFYQRYKLGQLVKKIREN